MASQRDIKRRIKSIKSTAQITKAMQMVAAARMRQAQRRVEESRPYSEHIRAIVADVAGTAGADVHPLLAQRDVRNVELLHITPDRGLAGGLPTNVNREAQRLVQETSEPVRVVSVGRKGRALARRLRWNMVEEFTDMGDRPGPEDVHPIAQRVLDDYTSGEVDRVYMVYTEFVSTMRQNAKRVQLLPVVPPEGEGDEGDGDDPQVAQVRLEDVRFLELAGRVRVERPDDGSAATEHADVGAVHPPSVLAAERVTFEHRSHVDERHPIAQQFPEGGRRGRGPPRPHGGVPGQFLRQ